MSETTEAIKNYRKTDVPLLPVQHWASTPASSTLYLGAFCTCVNIQKKGIQDDKVWVCGQRQPGITTEAK